MIDLLFMRKIILGFLVKHQHYLIQLTIGYIIMNKGFKLSNQQQCDIVNARRRLGYTQLEFAKIIGIKGYAMKENRNSTIRFKEYEKIKRFLFGGEIDGN